MKLKEKLLQLDIVIDNSYLDAYCDLCLNNKNTIRKKFKTQTHHIVPKYYFRIKKLPIDNSAENLINLKYKDHMLAHYYLALCAKDQKFSAGMIYAINIMLGNKNIRDNDKNDLKEFITTLNHYQELYELSLKIKADNLSKKFTGKIVSAEARKRMSEAKKGTKLSLERKRKISDSLKGRKKAWAGRKQSAEEIENRRKKLIGHKTSAETRRKIGEANKHKKLTAEQIEKLRQSHLGKPSWNKGLKANNSGKIQIFNPTLNKLKYINADELIKYLHEGWVKGNPLLSNARKGIAQHSKEVLCIEDDLIYPSCKIASKLPRCSCLSRSIADINTTTAGKHWVYLSTLKTWRCIDLRIIGYEEGSNSNKGKLGAFIVDYKGNQVKVGSGFSKELREEIWKNPEEYIGVMVAVQYFEETTNQNGGTSLRFPVFLDFRYDLA